ncbi:hypothetical protein ASPWEDRAFT_52659 [Aspergillus wentii DTO 134E9]|uniref:Integral membrane protein n=1 Tax=Aspergillus wentii DTO 134E9 TaxID=1073089 RepID=A0A1L9RHM4_ASPWE|nr:uncharacterized protein ASPWEDRAFT_52659 [Aspergillus wentii DTO 134E9]KAI9925769.1 hypothetical protein MW887_005575 [Aspergillus wentii]OJJ34439.1 hypothetical protein ASPWEDRAFT_52659 [Aspergillus wentii DTO 134E9]
MPTPLSQFPSLRLFGTIIGTICIAFGINAILRPSSALSFFEFDYPTTLAEKTLIDNMLIIYGARDVLMGLAAYITAYYDGRALGWTLLAISGVAYVDGFVCWRNGGGEWNHWGYAPVVSVAGVGLLGCFDGR